VVEYRYWAKLAGRRWRRCLTQLAGAATLAVGMAAFASTSAFTQVNTATILGVAPASGDVFGQPVILTAIVIDPITGRDAKGGAVTFTDVTTGTNLGSSALSGGHASINTSVLAVGTHTLQASYSGNSNFQSNSGELKNYVVGKANTTTFLMSSQSPSAAGQPVTFTATVSIPAASPASTAGTVTITVDGIEVTSTSPPSATYSTSALSVGTHAIAASYSGDGNFNGSPAPSIIQGINSPVPTVTSISLNTGPASGGTSVTVTGTNFAGASAVNFGSVPASFTINGPGSISATAPPGTGMVDITVTTSGGTSAASSVDHFTYASAPNGTAVSPNPDPLAGGTVLTITRTNFTGSTTVALDSNGATSFTVNSHHLHHRHFACQEWRGEHHRRRHYCRHHRSHLYGRSER
jgi:hypothetical protein